MTPRRRPFAIPAVALLAALASGGGSSLAQDAVAAERWAPVLVQHVLGVPPQQPFRHDYLVAVDYDGDWIAGNNLDRPLEHDIASTAYWWEALTPQRRYLGYLFYYLSNHDGSHRPGTPHDLQWLLVVAERGSQGAASDRFLAILVPSADGTMLALEQDPLPSDMLAATRNRLAASRGARPRGDTAPADVDFVVDDGGLRPVIYGTAGEHRLLTERPDRSGWPQEFELSRWTNWRGRAIPAQDWDFGNKKGPRRVADLYGLIYRPGGAATVTALAGRRAVGMLPHHWQELSYGLRPLDELWQRREDTKVFAVDGKMAGALAPAPSTLPPWLALVDGQVVSNRLFYDPDGVLAEQLDGIEPSPVTQFSFASSAEAEAQRAKVLHRPGSTPAR